MAEMDTVLIVDDSSFIVEGLVAFLKKKYRTLAAYGGAECLGILQRETPAVIILDIMMEPMDGWETLTRIKENRETRNIPVLMFSAKKISMEEAEKHRVSIDDFITKPVSPKKITEAIEKVLARRDTNRMIVERWEAAGITRDRIDEYLTLATSLEVDLSLCQNMKIQYDLVPHGEKEQEEFQEVIRVIEDRILHERDLIERLSREMNAIVDRQESSPGPAIPANPDTRGDGHAPSPETADFSAVADPGREQGAVPQSAPEPASPSSGAEPVPAAREPPVDTGAGTDGMIPPDASSPMAEETRDAVPSVPAREGPGTETPALPPQEAPVPPGPAPSAPPADGMNTPGSSGPAESGGTTATPSPHEAVPEEIPVRKVIPADIDIPPVTHPASPGNGAGTDLPMPWDVRREKQARSAVPGPERTGAPERAGAPGSPGILGRILSLVRSLFGGKQ